MKQKVGEYFPLARLCAPPTGGTLSNSSSSSSSSSLMDQEERGDLIRFYNQVYITPMRPFAVRYSLTSPSAGVRRPRGWGDVFGGSW